MSGAPQIYRYALAAILVPVATMAAIANPYVGTILLVAVASTLVGRALCAAKLEKQLWISSLIVLVACWHLNPFPLFLVAMAWMGHGLDFGPEADRLFAIYGSILFASMILQCVGQVMNHGWVKGLCGFLALCGYVALLYPWTGLGARTMFSKGYWVPTMLIAACAMSVWPNDAKPIQQTDSGTGVPSV